MSDEKSVSVRSDAPMTGVEYERVVVFPDGRVSRSDGGKIMGGRSAKTMANWRSKGWGPRPIVVGGRVFYDFAECLAMARGEKPIKPPPTSAE